MTTDTLQLTFDANGLFPVVIQDADSADVLMIGFMNDEALAATRSTGRVHFWSRSRNKLWRKGETSGHEQIVDEIRINCEQNSLLIKVRQIGAVCHDGYVSCFYRRVNDDGSLSVILERAFDPADVYGLHGSGPAARARQWYAAYEYLRDTDLTATSGTTRLLRSGNVPSHRIADELIELAGVLDGTHVHGDTETDLILEGSQVLYWIAVCGAARRMPWDELRLDRALATVDESVATGSCAQLLRAEATRWHADTLVTAEALHAVTALVAQAATSAGVQPLSLIYADLSAMRDKPYLAPLFDHA